ncbi:MAG: N-formylglutamate amidohydrolase [Hyphomicrobiales bacterium]
MGLFKDRNSRTPAVLFDPPFEVLRPAEASCSLVFNSPHSGSVYPEKFVESSKLDSHALRRSEDALMDVLFGPVVRFGAPLLKVNFPRAYLDVNREPYELDPAMFAHPLPDYVNTSSMRVAGGLGTIPRVVSETEEIYAAPLEFSDAAQRIHDLYLPYHACLENLLNQTRKKFGEVLLLDCHSMPSASLSAAGNPSRRRPDFVLGDRYGSTCHSAITDFLESALSDAGFSVARNKPYAGGHITQHYGRPAHQRHSIQIEVNRALYMNEETLEAESGFGELQDSLMQIMENLAAQMPGILYPGRLAAE